MLSSIGIFLVAAAIFLSAIISLAVKGKTYNRIIQIIILVVGLVGIALYGYGFSIVYAGQPVLAVVRTLMALIGMYLGENGFSDIAAAPLMQITAVQFIFWAAHFGAVYAFAGTVIVNIGASMLSRLRLSLSGHGQLVIIYGVNDKALSVGKQLSEKRKTALIFIGKASDTERDDICSLGCILYANDDNLVPSVGVLKKLGVKSHRRVTLYCMQDSASLNIIFAEAFMNAMEMLGCAPADTSLVIGGYEDTLENRFQALTGRKYGFGNVRVYDEHMVTARQMICRNPPVDTLKFDSTCRAEENFEALIVGFGQSGTAALHYLLLNGMFEGSEFKADVFTSDGDDVFGSFINRCPGMEDSFNITFHNANAKSREFYGFLGEHCKTLKYIVLCCGKSGNEELSYEIAKFLRYRGIQLPVYCLTKDEYTEIKHWETLPANWKLCDSDVLISDRTDRLAMAYNHYYCRSNGKTMLENWLSCDSFSRDSSRAAADFMPSVLRIARLNESTVVQNGLALSTEQELNLAKTEHLRWCSFHLNNGFSAMTKEQFDERCRQFSAERSAGCEKPIRITKDMERRTHACLVDWEALDELSKTETAITGQGVDYRQMDVDNIRVIPHALKLVQE